MNDNNPHWSIDHNQVIEVSVEDRHLISFVISTNSDRINSIDNHQYFQRIRKHSRQSMYNIDRRINLCWIGVNHHRSQNGAELARGIEDHLKSTIDRKRTIHFD